MCVAQGAARHERFLKSLGKINGGQNFPWLSSSEPQQLRSALFVDARLVIIIDDLRAAGQRSDAPARPAPPAGPSRPLQQLVILPSR